MRLTAVFLLVLLTGAAHAQTLYISPTGTGGAPCSSGTPCSLTTAHALWVASQSSYTAAEFAAGSYDWPGEFFVNDNDHAFAFRGATGTRSDVVINLNQGRFIAVNSDRNTLVIEHMTIHNGTSATKGAVVYGTSAEDELALTMNNLHIHDIYTTQKGAVVGDDHDDQGGASYSFDNLLVENCGTGM